MVVDCEKELQMMFAQGGSRNDEVFSKLAVRQNARNDFMSTSLPVRERTVGCVAHAHELCGRMLHTDYGVTLESTWMYRNNRQGKDRIRSAQNAGSLSFI